MKLMKIAQVCVCCLALAWSSGTWAQEPTLSDVTPKERGINVKNTPVSTANAWNAKVIEEFRANAGKVGGMFANTTYSCCIPPAQKAVSHALLRWHT